MSFIHLHNHSEYSTLDGASQVKDLPKAAKKLGQAGIALTDHGTMSGVLDFYKACEKEGVQPIVGMEGYITPFGVPRTSKDKTNSHLLLLAMNQTGYKNLMKLSTAAHLEGFYFRPRMDWDLLEQLNEGLITTTGCLGAELHNEWVRNGRFDKAEEAFQRFLRIFGDRFYAELQDHGGEDFQVYNEWLTDIATRYGVGMIATNDSHYIGEGDVIPHDMMLCVQTGKKVDDTDRMRMEGGSYYIKTTEAMTSLFGKYQGAISNTVELAKRCKLDLSNKGFHLPTFDIPPKFKSEDDYLKELCLEGLNKRYQFNEQGVAVSNSPLLSVDFEKDNVTREHVVKQLNYELGVISKMGFSRYFLIVWDIIEFAKKNNIWHNVRGSAAGAITSYVLGLTDIEPVSTGLYFERFLNPDRVSMPDIDMDFEHERRHEVIAYTIQKYGADKVAQIATFGTMKAKMAIKDMCRVLGISISDAEKLAAFVPDTPNMPVTLGDIKDNPALIEFLGTNPKLQQAFDAATKLEGTIRSVGTHAAGVVIADKPLTEYVPLMKVKGDESAMTQYEMGNLEAQGLLKMDYLGLSTLTLFHRVCDRINKKYGLSLNMDNIPINAPEIYKLLCSGRTLGIFQMESQGMTQVLTQMKPDRYENIIACVSLFRPGPLEYIPLYIKRMHKEIDIEYRHPDLSQFLEETMGIMIYQEQIMAIASGIAGYTKAESDTIRKAVGKKDKDALLKHEQKFISGAIEKGYPKALGEQIWKDIEYFARYGFNKAHAAVYAKIACQTAWLKANYPIEFMAEYFNIEFDDADKVKAAIQECKAIDIQVLPPSVNMGYADFEIEYPNKIRFGMKAIKGIGLDIVSKITDNRNSKYLTLRGFAERSSLPVRIIEPLIKAGACDDFGLRASLLKDAEALVKSAKGKARLSKAGQVMIDGVFDEEAQAITFVPQEITKELLDNEMEVLGFYFNEHPEQKAVAEFHAQDKAKRLSEFRKGQSCNVAGVVRKVKEITTKTNKQMAFVLIEDDTGSIDVTVFPKTWDEYKSLLKEGAILQFFGKYDDMGRNPKILADKILDTPNSIIITNEPQPESKRLYVFLGTEPGLIEMAINLAQSFEGDTPLSVVCDGKILDFNARIDIESEYLKTLQEMV